MTLPVNVNPIEMPTMEEGAATEPIPAFREHPSKPFIEQTTLSLR